MKAFITILIIAVCSFKVYSKDAELDKLFNLMVGTFSSEEQSKTDSSYYHINLVMHPIWDSNGDTKWLYVEQAVASSLKRPYRQRIYRVTRTGDNTFESCVFEIDKPERFIHGWENKEVFKDISPDNLIDREGCAVFLSKNEEACYSGSTNEKDCKSDFRGAVYATSIVTVCSDKIISWDQGWNSSDEQVWGAEKAGYIFDRIK